MSRALGKLVALLGVLVALTSASAGSSKVGQDKATDKAAIDPAKVKAQIEKAEQYYKDVLEADQAPIHESPHFVIVGKGPGKSPALVAGDLEQAYVKACKALELDKDPGPWQGKLTVFLLPSAKVYPRMIRITQRRKADEEETGSHSTQGTLAHAVACPGKAAGDLGIAATACTHMVALLADLKAKTRLPSWLSEGFGRATALHVGPANALAAERRKASALLAKNKRSADDIVNNRLAGEEATVLGASLVDYLAYSGRTAKFVPFLQGFAGDGKNDNGGFDLALKNAGVSREELTSNWEKYAKYLK